MTTVQPVRFTERPTDHLRLYRALGGRVEGSESDSRVLIRFGEGRLVLEAARPGHPAGSTEIDVVEGDDDSASPSGDLVVAPLIFAADVPATIAELEAHGGRPERAWTSGGYAEVAFDHGRVAVHEASTASVGLSFETDGDLDELHDRLAAEGFDAPIIDETFGRSLRIPDPDGTDAEIWVNADPRDDYGYTRL